MNKAILRKARSKREPKTESPRRYAVYFKCKLIRDDLLAETDGRPNRVLKKSKRGQFMKNGNAKTLENTGDAVLQKSDLSSKWPFINNLLKMQL